MEAESSIKWSTKPATSASTTSAEKPSEPDFQVTGEVVAYYVQTLEAMGDVNENLFEKYFQGEYTEPPRGRKLAAYEALARCYGRPARTGVPGQLSVDVPDSYTKQAWGRYGRSCKSEPPAPQQYRTVFTPRGHHYVDPGKIEIGHHAPSDIVTLKNQGNCVWTILEPNSYPSEPIERKPIRDDRRSRVTDIKEALPSDPWKQTPAEALVGKLICRCFDQKGCAVVPMPSLRAGYATIEQLGLFALNDATYDKLKTSCLSANSVMCRHDGKVGWYDIRTQVFTAVEANLPPQQDLASESQFRGLRVGR